MKKFIITLAFLLLPTAVSAAVYTFDSDTEANMGAVAVFDKDGRLTAVEKTTLSAENDKLITADISVSGETVKLFLPDGKIISNGTIKQEEVPTPPSYDDKLYKNNYLALTAPALVKKVLTVSEDGEDVYRLTLLYQGEEKVLTFGSDLLITSTADRYSDAIGKDASYLRAGDLIVLNYILHDEPDNICLIYRADNTEPIFNSEIASFLPLYTNSTSPNRVWSTDLKKEVAYRFGVVTDVTEKSLALTEKNGLASGVEYIPFHENAACYNYTIGDKTQTAVTGTIGIFESYIGEGATDADENIIDWSKTEDRCYALVRAIDGIATDIVIYRY